jgi:diguanylate cyclase (GGDEF)-like protein/PAS domain S-box-containing protein
LVIAMTLLYMGIVTMVQNQVLASYSDFEKRTSVKNLTRFKDAVEFMQQELLDRATRWEADDAPSAVMRRDRDWAARRMVFGRQEELGVNMIVLVDGSGRIVEGRSRGRNDVPPPNYESAIQSLHFTASSARAGQYTRPFFGLVKSRNNPLLIAVAPLKQGTLIVGWTVFGRLLTQGDVADLAKRQGFEAVELVPFHGDLSTAFADARNRLEADRTKNDEVVIAYPASSDREKAKVSGFGIIRDAANSAAFLLRITEERTIFTKGQETMRDMIRSILVVGVVFALIVFWILEGTIVRRVIKLGNQVDYVTFNAAARVSLKGRDELRALADQINAMLEKLYASQEELRRSREQLKGYNENLEETIHERTQKLAALNSVLEFALEGMAVFDPNHTVIELNSVFASMLCYDQAEMVGMDLSNFVSSMDHDRLATAFKVMTDLGKAEIECEALRKNGERFFVQLVLVPSYDKAQQLNAYHVFMKDITERKRLEKEIAYKAFHDSLCGLPNRLLFTNRVQQGLARAHREGEFIAVMFIDLDNFKVVNDSLGHEAGDELLKTVAKRLQEAVRPGDTVARMGGDEFTVLLERLPNADEAMRVANRIVQAMSLPVHLPENREIFVTCSVGIALNSDDCKSTEELLRDADTAMYEAKTRGKAGYVVFDRSMNESVVERLEIETGLRRAVENGEFIVYYQPIVDLKSGAISGAEALVRWVHPERGMVPPGKFIPIAEETGLISPIGYWVLERSCEYAKVINDRQGPSDPFVMSVNLSTRQLQQFDCLDRVREILTITGLDPRHLKLEVTESAMMDDMEAIISKLDDLRKLGIQLAIDDFGTGYSSLSYLRRLPVNTVKIDRSFVCVMGIEAEPTAIVSAIVTLCHALNLTVTGEGIENEMQMSQLQEVGCDYGQGYLFSKPINAHDFDLLLDMVRKSQVPSSSSVPSIEEVAYHPAA